MYFSNAFLSNSDPSMPPSNAMSNDKAADSSAAASTEADDIEARLTERRRCINQLDLCVKALEQEIVDVKAGRRDDQLRILANRPLPDSSSSMPDLLPGLKIPKPPKLIDEHDDVQKLGLDFRKFDVNMSSDESGENSESAPQINKINDYIAGCASEQKQSKIHVSTPSHRKAPAQRKRNNSTATTKKKTEKKPRVRNWNRTSDVDSVRRVSRRLIGAPEEFDSFKSVALSIWNKVNSHRYAIIFRKPVLERDAPGYSKIVKEPMDLSTIREQIQSGRLESFEELSRLLNLMCDNAMLFNGKGDEYYGYAKELRDYSKICIIEHCPQIELTSPDIGTDGNSESMGQGYDSDVS